jgi:hypothetical protein
MNLNMWKRAIFVGTLLAALGIPPGAFTAWPHQQEGPQKPPPTQQPATPAPPTGQQQSPQAGQVQSQAPQTSIAVESNVVNIDAVVTDQEGDILTNLKKENFRILDNDRRFDGIQPAWRRVVCLPGQELGLQFSWPPE